MQTKTRMNVYFEPGLLKQVEALALRRNVSKSAVIEAAVASFLSEDSAERLEAVFARRKERFEGFVQALGRRLARGDRFIKEVSRDIPAARATEAESTVGDNNDHPV